MYPLFADGSVVYLALFFLFLWCYQGYFIFLSRNPRKASPRESKNYQPLFSIIVPTFNESAIIAQKIQNLKDLAYKNYEVYFVDSSDDDTPRLISEGISGLAHFKLISAQKRNRVYQINQALPLAKGNFVVISDCDGLIQDNTLDRMIEEFSDDNIGVVGAHVNPDFKYKIDIVFWAMQNRMRVLESIYGHCSVMAGVCYAFRRVILDEIPLDVWADDIYVSFLANTRGFDTIYSPDIIAKEIRSPVNFKDFLRHKVFKAENNIKELIRFLPRFTEMGRRWQVVFLTRLLQVLILPIAIYPFLFLLAHQRPGMLIFSAVLVMLFLVPQFQSFHKAEAGERFPGLLTTIKIAVLTNLILLIAVARYLYFRGRVDYRRFGDNNTSPAVQNQ